VAILSGAEDLLEEHVVSEADVIAGDSVAMMLGAGAVRLVFQTDPADLSTVAKESVFPFKRVLCTMQACATEQCRRLSDEPLI
jgi:hypothetical protein